jgi:hypothetical protein
MVVAASVGCFLGPELYWLMASLEVVQAFLFFAICYLFFAIESENNLTAYTQIELHQN